jgi:hypothetical protein
MPSCRSSDRIAARIYGLEGDEFFTKSPLVGEGSVKRRMKGSLGELNRKGRAR